MKSIGTCFFLKPHTQFSKTNHDIVPEDTIGSATWIYSLHNVSSKDWRKTGWLKTSIKETKVPYLASTKHRQHKKLGKKACKFLFSSVYVFFKSKLVKITMFLIYFRK